MVDPLVNKADFTVSRDDHRTRLWRWFASRCGDPVTADDLVQETLLEAWRHRDRFTRSGGEYAWLTAIGNHVFRRWQRTMARSRTSVLGDDESLAAAAESARHLLRGENDDDSLQWHAEREELSSFIDRASDQLPLAARKLLYDRYYRDRSVAEMADASGMSAAHMAVRLQRARDRLRSVMQASFMADLESYGYAAGGSNTQRPTRLWCPNCGERRLHMHLDVLSGHFSLRCSGCNPGHGDFLYNWQLDTTHGNHPLGGIRSAPQALNRTLESATWKVPASNPQTCPGCGAPVACRFRPSQANHESIATAQIELWCPQCGFLGQSATFAGLAIFHPAGMQLWREHGRIRTERVAEMVVANTPAVAVTLSGISTRVSRTFAFSKDASRLLLID